MIAGTSPNSRARPRHSASHSPPPTNSAIVPAPICGASLTAPGRSAVKCAMASRRSSDLPAIHQAGAPAPTTSSARASAISGIEAKVTSGIATMFASAP